jgi:uncharacterized protein (DUF885 family)
VRHLFLIGCILFLTTGCRDTAKVAEAPGNNDDALKKAVSAYAVEFLRRNPTVNTYLGGSGLDRSLKDVDGTLRDHSAAALQQEDQWLMQARTTIEAIAPASLSPGARVDRDVALAQIAFLLHQHQVRRYQERALDTFISEPFRALDWQMQGMTPTGESTYGTPEEWTLVIRRVNAIPAFLERARDQLTAGVKANNVPDGRMIRRDGINTSEANAKYFAETLPKLAAERISGNDHDRLVADIRGASKAASDAYRAMRDFVADTYFESRDATTLKPPFTADHFAMGEEEYNWALKNNLRTQTTAAQLFDGAPTTVQETQRLMVDLARQIGAAHKWSLPPDGNAAVRAVFDQLSKDYPKSDSEMISWYRDAAFRVVEYARKTGLFDVPADYKLEVVETPPPLRASIDGAAYYPAPPFKNTGVGRYYVSPTGNDKAALEANNRAALADLSAHEGFPGHDWHYKVMTQVRDQISPVRWLTPGAVEDSSSMWEDSMAAEGWALYSEALLAEPQPGAPNGFYTPEERLYQLQGKLYRDIRIRVDTGIHTGRLSYDDAVTQFSEGKDFLPGSCNAGAPKSPSTTLRPSEAKRASCEDAERAIFRYSKWPTQAITYRLGRDQIFAMREEAAKRLGDKFSPKQFHLLFMRQGTIPSGYFREILLEALVRGTGGG